MSAISIVREPQALAPERRGEPLSLDPTDDAGAERRLQQAATAFEALFLRSLVRQMLEAQLDQGLFGEGAGSSVYQGMFVDHLADQLADSSPLGIAGLLQSQWDGSADPVERDTAAALARARKIEAARAYEDGARPEATPDPPSPTATPRDSIPRPHLHLETVREGIRRDPATLLGGQLATQVLGLPSDNEIGD